MEGRGIKGICRPPWPRRRWCNGCFAHEMCEVGGSNPRLGRFCGNAKVRPADLFQVMDSGLRCVLEGPPALAAAIFPWRQGRGEIPQALVGVSMLLTRG